MTLEDYKKILANIDVDKIPLLRLWAFGEPLLHRHLPEMLRLTSCQSYQVEQIELSTNGQYRNYALLEEVLKTGKVDQLVVSCDGDGTPTEYERLRPPSKWEVLLDFLANAKVLRDRFSPKTTLITRTICPDKTGEERWLNILQPLGWKPEFRTWIILPEAAENPSGHSPQVNNECCQELIYENLYCDYDGTVLPCCLHPRAFEIGNLKENKYSEIWHSKRKIDFMINLITNRKNMTICGKCEQPAIELPAYYQKKIIHRYSETH